MLHLVLEVVAYAADEATERGGGSCVILLHGDGSVSVADDGRGTDTRFGADGVPVRKPVIATKDLRFFDSSDSPALTDGHPRRGLSVAAALSSWLVHTNRPHDDAWTQRYEHGIPVTGLVPVDGDGTTGTTGTTVHFMADADVLTSVSTSVLADEIRRVVQFPAFTVDVQEEEIP